MGKHAYIILERSLKCEIWINLCKRSFFKKETYGQKNFASKKNLAKKNFCHKNFWSKNILVKKNVGQKFLVKKVIDKTNEIKAVMKNLEKALALCSLNPSPEVLPARSSVSLPCSLSSTKSTFTTVSIAPLSITSAADNSSDGNIPQLDGHAEEPQKAEVYEHQEDDDDEWSMMNATFATLGTCGASCQNPNLISVNYECVPFLLTPMLQ